jgi:predicted nicotinamide N-methyase
MVAPDAPALAALLDEYAPFGPAPLVPEVAVFQGRVLLELWSAAERLAGRDLPPPYWAYPWPGGIALARLLLDRPELVAGARVLDLGAGGGVAALAAARAGAAEVVANDRDPWAIATVALAAARQGLGITPLLAELTVSEPPESGAGAGEVMRSAGSATAAAARGMDVRAESFDLILCGDLSYERSVAPRIRAFLEAGRGGGARVLAADAGRAYFDPSGFTLQSELLVPVPRDLEGADERPTRVYLLD